MLKNVILHLFEQPVEQNRLVEEDQQKKVCLETEKQMKQNNEASPSYLAQSIEVERIFLEYVIVSMKMKAAKSPLCHIFSYSSFIPSFCT